MLKRPRVFAVAGWRYEPEWLVAEMRRNLSWCDEVVIVDDRARTGELWIHEGEYRGLQRRALLEAGIREWDWVLVTSPDERWSSDAASIIHQLVRNRLRYVWSFPLREMWTPTMWRLDGQWGRKRRPRLYPFLIGQAFDQRRIQTQPIPVEGGYQVRSVQRPAIYHLENIDPAGRLERVLVYDALSPGSHELDPPPAKWLKVDPERQYIARYGYAYLCDPRGVRLAPIPTPGFRPHVGRVYRFSVPDELLYAESGIGRRLHVARIADTLGIDASRLNGSSRG